MFDPSSGLETLSGSFSLAVFRSFPIAFSSAPFVFVTTGIFGGFGSSRFIVTTDL